MVQVAIASEGRLSANVSTGAPPLQSIHIGAGQNALIDVPGQPPGLCRNLTVHPSTGAQFSFIVRQQTPGQAVNVPLVVTDACGDWPTFVGAGPTAWQAGSPTAVPQPNAPGLGATPSAETSKPSYSAQAGQAAGPGSQYLSDLTWASTSNGYGPVEKDMSNGESQAGDGHTLTISGATFAKGLGVHAASDIRYNLGGNCNRFTAAAGVDAEEGGLGSVVFQVFADGTKLFDSGVVTGTSGAKNVDVSVAGKNQLQLVVTDGGDGPRGTTATGRDAQLACGPPGATTLRPPARSHAGPETSTPSSRSRRRRARRGCSRTITSPPMSSTTTTPSTARASSRQASPGQPRRVLMRARNTGL